MPASYYLKKDVFTCMAGGICLGLDARTDRYFWLTAEQSCWLDQILRTDRPSPLTGKQLQFAGRLLDRGLITQDLSDSRSKAAAHPPSPRYCVFDMDDDPQAGPRWKYAPGLVLTLLRCWRPGNSRRGDLRRRLNQVRRWRERIGTVQTADTADIVHLTRQFHALTPYFFSIHDACFFRSFLLVGYLARFGIQADWIFGMRLAPFGAHCWVVWKDMLLNEALDTVAEYQPVMRV
ncbi:lasso peptide biosynthesis B2 protein [Henriciella sp.]|jgi:hypothetical protein|uniref:lasso peptide biosynthesis B2 protein n=1 Tax=Henriciella sp. TaxID=1968823 RepID=UPI000C39DAE5|nr:lasso peptide biosynthesis B2 protein [Henriciella sp.]MAN74213.1 hypothetical protein [Henriciella sp.]|tara:strand:+ start:1044 stop:1745 length:702 start_codon:yes stop_codon:yes gene_type:complete